MPTDKTKAFRLKSRDNLTGAQAQALFCLIRAKALGQLAAKGQETSYEHSWSIRVHSVAVRHLESLGWARAKNVLLDGTEVKGADLVHLLGQWSTKYEVTRRGEQAWRRFTVRQRYGLPEQGT
jgi:hypothetical protein